MGKQIKLTRRDSERKLRRELSETTDEAQKTRIRAIISVKNKKNHTETAKQLCITRSTLLVWIRAYNEGGTKALQFSKGGRAEGRPIWDTTIFEKLSAEIDKGGRYWSIPLMQEWIKENYDKEIPESTVWYHMRDLNYSYKSARPHPAQGDKKAQAAFKKGGSRKR